MKFIHVIKRAFSLGKGFMTLCDWIEKTTPKEVARLLNVDPSTVSSWKIGRSTPKAETIQKIIAVSKGKVTYRGILGQGRGKND